MRRRDACCCDSYYAEEQIVAVITTTTCSAQDTLLALPCRNSARHLRPQVQLYDMRYCVDIIETCIMAITTHCDLMAERISTSERCKYLMRLLLSSLGETGMHSPAYQPPIACSTSMFDCLQVLTAVVAWQLVEAKAGPLPRLAVLPLFFLGTGELLSGATGL